MTDSSKRTASNPGHIRVSAEPRANQRVVAIHQVSRSPSHSKSKRHVIWTE
jgi:hypothetical protein